MIDIYGRKCEFVRRDGIMVTVRYSWGEDRIFHHTKVFYVG